jgi:hypothetical protein
MSIDLMLDPPSCPLANKINYRDPVFLVGSCFTEHMGKHLKEMKFPVCQNPHGILFDPYSVANTIVSIIHDRMYGEADLFYYNELWQSWRHHSLFSNINKEKCLDQINTAAKMAHGFLKNAKWLIITLGSSFSYRIADSAPGHCKTKALGPRGEVANCHRAPAQWFQKWMMSVEETNAVLDNALHQLFQFSPAIQVIFTVSPVRHIRDGVVENNRSKARLIEVVHNLAGKFPGIYYFPAYELVIDVLRDYRFYDIDLVHPNYLATSFVLEQFELNCIDEESKSLLEELKKINQAKRHRPVRPETLAHSQFLKLQSEKIEQLRIKYPSLDLEEDLKFFQEVDGKPYS